MRELGRGGMGVVYEALDPRTQQRVALKTVGFQTAEVPSRGLQRLQREAQALTRLSHPGLVPYYGSGVGPQGYFLAMGLVEGTSLEDVLQRSGALPLGRALQIMGDVGEALAYVHARGLLHRDVKPANLLLSTSGRVVLTDFGLVKLSAELHAASQASLTRSGAMLGTPGYWPPEQAFGKLEQVGPASDVYSWAATLYALLGGQPPRAGRSLLEVLAGFDEPVLSLRLGRPEIPAWLDALLQRCLATEPDDRPALGEALQELHSFGGSAGGTSGGLRLQLVLAATLAVLGVVGVGVLGWALLAGGEPASASSDPRATASGHSSDGDPEPGSGGTSQPEAGGTNSTASASWAEFERQVQSGDHEGGYRYAHAWKAREPGSAEALRAVVQACVLTHRDDEGVTFAAELVERLPNQARGWGLYAVTLLSLGRRPDALEAAERCYQLDPGDHFGLPAYAQCLAYVERYEDAERVYSELLALAPAGVFFAERATVRTNLGDATGAQNDVAEALARDPNHPLAYFARGRLKLRLLDDSTGADDLRRAMELGLPNPERVLDGLGPFLCKQGRPGALLTLLEHKFPGSRAPTALLWRARALLDLERGPEALAASTELMQKRSLASDVLVHARALAQTGDLAGALAGFEGVYTQLTPGDKGGYCREAAERAAMLALGNLTVPDRTPRALRAIERWLQSAPNDLEALGMRIAVWASQDRYPEALAESERIAPLVDRSRDPTIVSRFYFSWSDILWRGDRLPEALHKLTHSLRYDAAWMSFVQRGRMLGQLQHNELAEADFVRALELAPNSARAWFYFMVINQQQGHLPRAAIAAQRVVDFATPADRDKVEHAQLVIETARSMR